MRKLAIVALAALLAATIVAAAESMTAQQYHLGQLRCRYGSAAQSVISILLVYSAVTSNLDLR